MQSVWAALRVAGVTAGASYESVVYDRYLAVETAGTRIELFDMTPMIAGELTVGAEIEALIAADAHTGLVHGPERPHRAVVTALAAPVDQDQRATVRPEVYDRRWALLTYANAIPVLIDPERLGNVDAGAAVSWQDTAFFLMGWRYRAGGPPA